MSDFYVRTMQREELDQALEWAAQEGWNPGLHDAACYYQADPNGFLVGVLDDQLIGCISAINYHPHFAFIGFYLVKPDYRGRGYGWQIWQAALAYLGDRNIGLDGVAAQQANYQKSGFKLAYNNVRYAGSVNTALAQLTQAKPEHPDAQIHPITQLDFDRLANYEAAFFPCERHDFLKAWVSQENSHAMTYTLDDKVLGYGVIRQCLEGYKVAPLFADTPEVAQSILTALLLKVDHEQVFYLDVPECHQAGLMLVKKLAMEPVFATARMYTQEAPKLPLGRIYGVTSFEIG